METTLMKVTTMSTRQSRKLKTRILQKQAPEIKTAREKGLQRKLKEWHKIRLTMKNLHTLKVLDLAARTK